MKYLLAALLLIASNLACAAPVLFASRFNSGDAVDSQPVGHRTPLVLVHGLGGAGEGWENFLQTYARNPAWRAAFKPYTFRYGSTASDVANDPSAPRTISALGAALRDSLQSFYDKPAADGGFGTRSIAIVAHSMGGLVARSMMQEHSFADGRRGGERVLQLVTLGTPHHGSPLADAGFTLGLATVDEFLTTYAGFLAGMAWDNQDALDMPGGLCNPWLAHLNSYGIAGRAFGTCGFIPGSPKRGFYERIVAYGARNLQTPDLQLGFGTFKPGSSPALLIPYALMHDALPRTYQNDGIVPYDSAQFAGQEIRARGEANDCDHRFLERGYQVTVRTLFASTSEWTFCGSSRGGTIAQEIALSIASASQAERVFDWAESAYAPYLQPAGAVTDFAEGYSLRYYAATNAYVGVKDGNVFYRGPASNAQIVNMGPLATFLSRAQSAGF